MINKYKEILKFLFEKKKILKNKIKNKLFWFIYFNYTFYSI